MSAFAHPSDGDLLALLDGELPEQRHAEALRHARECSACNDRLTELEHASETTDELLDLLVQPEPSAAMDLSAVLLRARRGRRWRAGLIAAAVTLVVAAAAGATVARPFVRAVAARIWAALHPNRGTAPPTSLEPVGAQAGVAVIPGAFAEVVFDTTQSSGELRVSLADTTELAIRSSAPVTYRVYHGGVIVHNQGSGASYDVIIPRAAPHVRIAIVGRVIFEKTGLQIVSASVAHSTGQYVFTLQ